jgi:ribonuclease-3
MPRRSERAKDPLAALEDRIGWRFTNRALLEEAVRHSSAVDQKSRLRSYERLEFFGDRVLNLTIAEHLFTAFPDVGESSLAHRFNALVNRTACARAARRAELGAALTLSSSEDQAGGRDKENILADACEALIAAIYLDGGHAPAREFIVRFWGKDLETVENSPRDPKSALQEWAASQKRALSYQTVERTGPEHAPRFIVEALVAGMKPARGEGGSKREAEQAAAQVLLKRAKRKKGSKAIGQ